MAGCNFYENVLDMWHLFSDDGRTKPVPKNKSTPAPTPTEYLCLIRAYVTGSGNKKNKISTVVSIRFSLAHSLLVILFRVLGGSSIFSVDRIAAMLSFNSGRQKMKVCSIEPTLC